jgi:hypothetical protein
MTEFTCNWGMMPVIITVSVIIVIIFISVKCISPLVRRYRSKGKNQVLVLLFLILSFLPVAAVIFTVLFMPLKISVRDGDVYVKQLKGGISIPLAGIVEIRRYAESDRKNTVRTFGSGGLFGYLGKFENPELGRFQMYVADMNNTVLIRTVEGVYVVSCENPDNLVELVAGKK